MNENDGNLLNWKEYEMGYLGPTPLEGYCGKLRLFTITQALTRSDEGDYVLRSALPWLKNRFDRRGTVEELKEYAEEVFDLWLKEAGLQKVEGSE